MAMRGLHGTFVDRQPAPLKALPAGSNKAPAPCTADISGDILPPRAAMEAIFDTPSAAAEPISTATQGAQGLHSIAPTRNSGRSPPPALPHGSGAASLKQDPALHNDDAAADASQRQDSRSLGIVTRHASIESDPASDDNLSMTGLVDLEESGDEATSGVRQGAWATDNPNTLPSPMLASSNVHGAAYGHTATALACGCGEVSAPVGAPGGQQPPEEPTLHAVQRECHGRAAGDAPATGSGAALPQTRPPRPPALNRMPSLELPDNMVSAVALARPEDVDSVKVLFTLWLIHAVREAQPLRNAHACTCRVR
jgi:hypothetical protein